MREREASFYWNYFVYDSFKSLPLRAQETPTLGGRKSGEEGGLGWRTPREWGPQKQLSRALMHSQRLRQQAHELLASFYSLLLWDPWVCKRVDLRFFCLLLRFFVFLLAWLVLHTYDGFYLIFLYWLCYVLLRLSSLFFSTDGQKESGSSWERGQWGLVDEKERKIYSDYIVWKKYLCLIKWGRNVTFKRKYFCL